GRAEPGGDEFGVGEIESEITADTAEDGAAKHVGELAHDVAGAGIRDIRLLFSEKASGERAGRIAGNSDLENPGRRAAKGEAGRECWNVAWDAAERGDVEYRREKHGFEHLREGGLQMADQIKLAHRPPELVQARRGASPRRKVSSHNPGHPFSACDRHG